MKAEGDIIAPESPDGLEDRTMVGGERLELPTCAV